MFTNWQLQPDRLFNQCHIIPVITVNELELAVSLTRALLAGGLNTLEITLRTPSALEIITGLTEAFPDAIIGAGTVLNPVNLRQATQAGAQFAFSPGLTPNLLKAGQKGDIPLIPGCSQVSEMMLAMDYGYQYFKLFPAEVSGGCAFLKSIHAPLSGLRFCPTGGINEKNYMSYLNLPNVDCVGGSWMIQQKDVNAGQWQAISDYCRSILANIKACQNH